MNKLVLSIFPGIDLLGRAFEEEGFCVVRGPDVLWGGDIRNFHPPAGVFDGIIGGPPCQDFSCGNTTRRSYIVKDGQKMLREAARVIGEVAPEWWLLENVPGVPDVTVKGYEVDRMMLNARWVGSPQNRKRVFQFGTKKGARLEVDVCLFENPEYANCVVGSEMAKGYWPHGYRNPYVPARPWPILCRLMGLPQDFDIPPFTKGAKGQALGNGVPLPMGRAMARAVKKCFTSCAQM